MLRIHIKEAIQSEEYLSGLEKHKEDPILYPKPTPEIVESILNLYPYDIAVWRILSVGELEEDKTEIKILTPFGAYYSNYSKKLDDELTEITNRIAEDYLISLKSKKTKNEKEE